MNHATGLGVAPLNRFPSTSETREYLSHFSPQPAQQEFLEKKPTEILFKEAPPTLDQNHGHRSWVRSEALQAWASGAARPLTSSGRGTLRIRGNGMQGGGQSCDSGSSAVRDPPADSLIQALPVPTQAPWGCCHLPTWPYTLPPGPGRTSAQRPELLVLSAAAPAVS